MTKKWKPIGIVLLPNLDQWNTMRHYADFIGFYTDLAQNGMGI